MRVSAYSGGLGLLDGFVAVAWGVCASDGETGWALDSTSV